MQDEYDALLEPEVAEAALLDLGPEAEPEDLPVVPCHWADCDQLFWEIEPLMTHVATAHIDAAPLTAKIACEWVGCPRTGKPAGTRSALVAHLRSHTGERPFLCTRPECDKTFARMDALQKHSQTMHAEKLPLSRKPPTKKRKLDDTTSIAEGSKRGDGDDSIDGDTSVVVDAALDDGSQPADEVDDESMAEIVARHPDESPAFVRFVVTAAKHRYAISEHAALVDELDLLSSKEQELREEKDRLVERAAAQELGPLVVSHFSQPDPPNGGLGKWKHATRTTLPGGRSEIKLGKWVDDPERMQL